jgi:hypothetical protein
MAAAVGVLGIEHLAGFRVDGDARIARIADGMRLRMRQRRNLEAGSGGVCAADLIGGQQTKS